MRAALLSLALLAIACSSESRPASSGPDTQPGAAQPDTELTRSERVTLRVLGMT
ncbi:MAG TPA: hypothetical protein VML75_01585 [Kofleriaceae bacterium]|nr:hypothetical protein [Kofleriaceae bacterium]